MAEVLLSRPFDGDYPEQLEYVYQSPTSAGVVIGGEQTIILGDFDSTLFTRGLVSCSAYAIWNRKHAGALFGLLHSNSGFLSEVMNQQLSLLRGGEAVQISGNKRRPQERVRRELKNRFDITTVDGINLNTLDEEDEHSLWWDFDVVYHPRMNCVVTVQTRPKLASKIKLFDNAPASY